MAAETEHKTTWIRVVMRAIGLAFLLLLWLIVLAAIFWVVPPKPRLTLPVSDHVLAALSPDGKTVVTLVEGIPGSSGGPMFFWDAQTATQLAVIGDRKNQFRTSVQFSADGKLMAVRELKEYPNEELVIFDLATLAKLASIEVQTPISRRPTVRFSPDGHLVAFNARQNDKDCVKVWDFSTGKEATTMQGGDWPSFFFPDGKILVTSGRDKGVVRLFDAQTGEPRFSWLSKVAAEEVSPGGRFAAAHVRAQTRRYSPTLKIWDVATQKEIATLEHESQPRFVSDSTLATEYIDPDSREVRLMLWNLHDGKQTADLTFTMGPLLDSDALFTPIPGSNFLAVNTSRPFSLWGKTVPGPPELKIFDTSTGQEVGSLVDWIELTSPRHTLWAGRNYKFKISRDAKAVATESRDGFDLTVQLWDIPPRKRIIWIIGLLAVPTLITVLNVWKWLARRRNYRQKTTDGISAA